MAEDRIERRLTAILAAEVAGYSRLVGEDEEGTLAPRRRAARTDRPGHRQAQGAHRQDDRRRSPRRVRQRRRRIALSRRVAARDCRTQRRDPVGKAPPIPHRHHQGDLVVEDGDIFGDGVNVAARLDLAFEDLGNQELKNIAQKVRVYSGGAAEAPTARQAVDRGIAFKTCQAGPEYRGRLVERSSPALSRIRGSS